MLERFDSLNDLDFDETAYEEGARARLGGMPIEDCPYRLTEWFADSWRTGWAAAGANTDIEGAQSGQSAS